MAVAVYTVGAARVRFSGPLQTIQTITILEGRVFRPSSTTSVFTLVSQHDTNMEDNMDWEAEWNELANKAWVSEAQLAGSTQL